MKETKNLSLFTTFFKIGAFTFGGGYAMIPLIIKEVVENKKWISNKEVLDIIAIAESTPGPIAINMATFIGYKVNKVKGAIFTTLGVTLPSFVIITAISYILNQFQTNEIIQYAFNGIRVGVLVLILKALLKMFKECSKNLISYIIMCITFIAVVIFNYNVIIMLLISAIIGLIYQEITLRRMNK